MTRSVSLLFLCLVSLCCVPFGSNGAEILEGLISQFLQSSPTSMLHGWLSVMDPPECIGNALILMGTAVQTKDEELETLAKMGTEKIGYNCNLTGVDSECFIQYIAAALGESWGSAREDVGLADEMINKYLKPEKKTMTAALSICVAGSKLITLLSSPEKKIQDPSLIINEAKDHCKMEA